MDNKQLKNQPPSDGYEAPQASRLSNASRAKGGCEPAGSGDASSCAAGNSAAAQCENMGSSATNYCTQDGNSAIQHCLVSGNAVA